MSDLVTFIFVLIPTLVALYYRTKYQQLKDRQLSEKELQRLREILEKHRDPEWEYKQHRTN